MFSTMQSVPPVTARYLAQVCAVLSADFDSVISFVFDIKLGDISEM